MEQLKIAQFYNNVTGSKDKKTELLKKVDVNYSIPDTLADKKQIRTWSGYTSLHFAVKRNDLELANELLEKGADLIKQGTKDGCTPLHIAVNSTSFIRKSLYEMSGLLQEYRLINTLLSKQVEVKNISNPINKNGVSHLHIASIVNHTEAVHFFAKTKESLNQQIGSDTMYWWPGFTPLHCAIKYSSVKAADILLQHGADVHIKNAKGMSCVHLLVDRILDMTDFITMGQRTHCMPYEEEIERIESIIKLMLKATTNDGIFVDDTGLSTLHVASTLRDKSILEDFIKQDNDVNVPVKSTSKFWPGWTPLHFAACSNIEMMMLLMQNGANIMNKNSKGETALDLCARRFTAADVQLILSITMATKDIILSDNSTKLSDWLSVMDDYNKFSDFLQKLKDVNITVPLSSPIWPGYNLLHLSVSLNEKTKPWKEFEKKFDVSRDADAVYEHYNCTEDQEALYSKRIELCLEHNCSVNAKNAKGQTPVHLAFCMLKDAIAEKLLLHSKDNLEDQNGLSHLHIACALGKLDAVTAYVSQGVDVNSRVKLDFDWHEKWYDTKILINVRANSTPLHVAVLFGHRTVVEHLLESNADVYATDSLGLTPVHLLMSTCNRPRRLAQLLFEATPHLRDSVSAAGLSHLHVAAWANSREAVDQLLLAGAQLDRVVDADVKQPSFLARLAGKTALHVALDEDSEAAVKPLLRAGADVHAKDPRGISALQHSVQQLSDLSTKHLVRMLKAGRCELEQPAGMTLLHVACGNCEIKWARRLLKRGADVNARIREGKLQGATPLYVLVNEASFLDTNAPRLGALVRLLLNNGADVSLECAGRTALHLIYESVFVDFFLEASDDEDIDEMEFLLPVADLLLKNHRSYNVNPTNHQGFSHFHFACLRNDVETAKKFLDHGVDVNEPIDPFADDSDGFTPLHFAMAHRSREVAYLLLERGADVNAEDANGNKPLHAAIKRKFVDLPLIEAMLSRGADIHAKNVSEETLLYCLLRSGGLTLQALEFFLDRGCFINIMDTTDMFHQGIIGLAMRNAAPTELQSILERLMQVCEVRKAIEDGFNVIQSIVAIDQNGELSVDDYLNAIEMLRNIGCGLDQQDSEGVTALHEAVSFYNLEAVDALLQLGADINVVNNENECPFVDKIISNANDYDESREMDVVKALASHIWKMRFIELEVEESNLRCLERTEKQIPLVTLLEQSCQDELTKAKETEIYQGLTVKDFLSELGAVAEYPRMCPIRRNIVDKYFKCIMDIHREFPEFCGLLAFQYKKTCARMELWQPAKEAIALICQFEIPDLCVEAILRYFTNNEMRRVIQLVEKLFNYA